MNSAKGRFRFAPVMYLEHALNHIDTMPQNSFDTIIGKYVEVNSAHPFREGNGRAARICLYLILINEIRQVFDWNLVERTEYLSAMERSPEKTLKLRSF